MSQTAAPPASTAANPVDPSESPWSAHWQLICAAVAGGLLILAAILKHHSLDHSFYFLLCIGVAFAIGLIYGVAAAWDSLLQWQLDINLLMVIGALLAIAVNQTMDGAILLFLFTLSGALEKYAMQRTRGALQSLMKLFPKEAILLAPDGTQKSVLLEALQIGDEVLVKPGENVPADGLVTQGASAVDESAITGEYLPREKNAGAPVYAGTLNQSGRLVIRVNKLAHDTALARIIHLVSEAREEKAPVQQLFDRIGTLYTICILSGSVLAALVLKFGGFVPDWSTAVYRSITLLIVASPCALIISTPVVSLSAIATFARRGIIMKGGRHIESLAKLKAVVMDKTGTLTTGQVRLVSMETVPDFAACRLGSDADDSARRLLAAAASLEANSTHPLAGAVLRAAEEAGAIHSPAEAFEQIAGHGLRGKVDGHAAGLGKLAMFREFPANVSASSLHNRIKEMQSQGQTAVVLCYGTQAAILNFQDTLRPEVPKTLSQLHALGIRPLVMLTGDNHLVAEALTRQVGLDEVHAELLPEDKLKKVEELVAQHHVVAMVGDGINDAPALARATVGIAMGSIGSDAALEAADVVLLSDRIDRLPWLIRTARRAHRVMVQNISFALLVIAVLIVAALTGKVGLPLGIIGHEGSTVLVVLNGLRLLLIRDIRPAE